MNSPTELQKAIERATDDLNRGIKTYTEVYKEDLSRLLDAAKQLEAVTKERDEFEYRIIELACKGTSETRFNSVAEMQVAQLHKWWKESDLELSTIKSDYKQALDLAKNVVDKVESGRMRSRETYTQSKALLSVPSAIAIMKGDKQ